MLIPFLTAKIHRATVTGCDINYEGSISIDEEIKSLQWTLEDADSLREELKAILIRTIKELKEIRTELTPK